MQLEMKMAESLRNLSGLDESRNLVITYEANLQKLSGQVDRLNTVLRKKVQELDEANRKINEYEYELKKGDSVRHEM